MHNVCHTLEIITIIDWIVLSTVHPAHLAFALLNEGAGDQVQLQGGIGNPARSSVFYSVIQKAGGDPVRSELQN
jgi:hypothetical protein